MFRAAQVKKVRKASTGMADNFPDPDDLLANRSPGHARAQYPIIAGIDLTWLCRFASNFAASTFETISETSGMISPLDRR